MANTNKGVNFRAHNINKLQSNKHKGKKGNTGSERYKKTAHGKTSFVNSIDVRKKERAKKVLERQALRAEKQKEAETEQAKAQQEKQEKIRQYKKKRLEKTKAISKRTQRGQPLMKDRMQLLLKKIEEIKRNE